MLDLGSFSVSSMNYFFLRQISGKEQFSETVIGEIDGWLACLVTTIRNNELTKNAEKVIKQELLDGPYCNFTNAKKRKQFFEHMSDALTEDDTFSLDRKEALDIVKFYRRLSSK